MQYERQERKRVLNETVEARLCRAHGRVRERFHEVLLRVRMIHPTFDTSIPEKALKNMSKERKAEKRFVPSLC